MAYIVELKNLTDHTSPLSHATVIGPWIYTLGTGGIDYKTRKIVSHDVVEQAEQSMKNLASILAACGATLKDVVKANVYLVNIEDYDRVNAVYMKHMGGHRPARCCIGVASLPSQERMKIEMVAYVPGRA